MPEALVRTRIVARPDRRGVKPDESCCDRQRIVELKIANQISQLRIAGWMISRERHWFRDIGRLGIKGQRELEAEFLRDLNVHAVVASERPYDRPRRAADELRHLLPGMIQVVGDSAAKRGVIFISAPRCVAPCVSGGELISLRIAERRFMQVVAVRCKFDQVALRHLTNLVRTEKAPARNVSIAVAHGRVHRRIEPVADEREYRGNPIREQQREDTRVSASISVIERDQDCVLRQRLLPAACRIDIVERDWVPAIRAQVFEEPDQVIDGDRIVIEVAAKIDDIVKSDDGEMLAGARDGSARDEK